EHADYHRIHERTSKAAEWFLPKIDAQLIAALADHINAWAIKKRTKKYVAELNGLLVDLKRKREQLRQCATITEALAKGDALPDVMARADGLTAITITPAELPGASATPKAVKGETKRISFDLFQSGKSVEEIASERGLTPGTVI